MSITVSRQNDTLRRPKYWAAVFALIAAGVGLCVLGTFFSVLAGLALFGAAWWNWHFMPHDFGMPVEGKDYQNWLALPSTGMPNTSRSTRKARRRRAPAATSATRAACKTGAWKESTTLTA
jgi:hypothetical protein